MSSYVTSYSLKSLHKDDSLSKSKGLWARKFWKCWHEKNPVVHLAPQPYPPCCTMDNLLDSLLQRHFCAAMCQFHTPYGGMTT
jgi:hypothetical protein